MKLMSDRPVQALAAGRTPPKSAPRIGVPARFTRRGHRRLWRFSGAKAEPKARRRHDTGPRARRAHVGRQAAASFRNWRRFGSLPWKGGVDPPEKGESQMLGWALVFLVLAIVAGALGFFALAGLAASIAKILFVISSSC